MISCLLTLISLSVWIGIFHRIVVCSLSTTVSGLCSYHMVCRCHDVLILANFPMDMWWCVVMSLNVFRLAQFWASRIDMISRFVKLATHSTQWVRAIFDNVAIAEPFCQALILCGNNQPLCFCFFATVREPLASSVEVYIWIFHSFGVFPMKCLVFPPCR